VDTPPQIPFDLSPKPSHSFDNFLVSESNAAAVAAVKAWPEWPSPILMLVGPQGSGKTHLGKAWQTFSGGVFIDEAHAMDEASLFKVMNQALNGDIPGLLLADRQAPQDWDTQMPDLRSRLSNTPIAMIDEHDDEILEPVVRKLFQDKGRDVSQGLISYLLKYQERSIAAQRIIASELEAAAQRQKADLTKAFAAKYLKERLERDLFAVPGEE
jgi:chromosomal replication initiation ATPase DnaA